MDTSCKTGIQTELWKQFFTPTANTDTGVQRGCAVSNPGDAQIQTTEVLGKLVLFGAEGWTR